MIKLIIEEDANVSATNNIPSLTTYDGYSKDSSVYYFGNPPEKPQTLSDFLKGKQRKAEDDGD